MPNVDISIAALGDPPTFPWMKPVVPAELHAVSILEKGCKSGAVSVAIHAQLPTEEWVTIQLSASMFLSLAGAVRGACERFGDTRSLR